MRQRYSRYSTCFNLLFATITCFLLFPPGLIAADVTLGWDPNPEEDLAGYKIHYKEKSYGQPYDGQGADQGDSPIIVPLILIEDRDNPQYRLTGLQNNKIYFFVLTAFDDADPANESDFSNVMSNLRITHPGENFGLNKSSNYTSYTVSGHGLTEASIQILANGVLLGVADTDPNGNFAIDVDFSALNEGAVELTAKQKESTTYPVTGIYDLTTPRVASWDLRSDEMTITFNERHMQNTSLESNYRFNPSMIFREWGGIIQYSAYSYLLSMRSIPEYEIISLEMTNITDAVGNPLTPARITINDRDQDQMPDDWEVASGLDPLLPNSGADADGDGFSNLREFQARTDPHDAASSPLAIVDSIPQPNAGILNSARVPGDTGFAVFIASVHGIDVGDPESIRFTVDDGKPDPYLRDLSSAAMRVVEVGTGSDLSLLWVVYDRSLETGLPVVYDYDANIHITVEVEDVAGNRLPSQHFEFNIESETENEQAWGNLPELAYYAPVNAVFGYDEGIEIVSGEPAGARIEYDSSEPLTPIFGPINEIEGVVAAGMEEVGAPLNLLPHTVFNKPVKVYIPVPDGFDITEIGIYYHNGVEWLPACDKYGNLLPCAEGWMVAGSRVNHMENSPPLIEIQVYHFSGAQAGVVVNTTGTSGTTNDRAETSGSGGVAVVKCFIDTAAYDVRPALGLPALLWVLGILGLLPAVILYQRFKWNGFYHKIS